MENQVQNFDPSALMQGVKDRIKATFVSLVPDDRWDEMVKQEIDAFFTPQKLQFSERDKYKDGTWHTTKFAVMETEMSPFRFLVWEECTKKCQQFLSEKIQKEIFEDSYGGYDQKEELKKIIVEAAPLAAAKFFESISYGMANQLQSQINNINYNR